jgi:hypothetical protein
LTHWECINVQVMLASSHPATSGATPLMSLRCDRTHLLAPRRHHW